MHETLVGILIGFTVISLSRKGTLVCVWKNLWSFELIPMRNVSIQASSNVMNMSWWNVVIQLSCRGFKTIAGPMVKPHITRECWWLSISSCGETRCKSLCVKSSGREAAECDGVTDPGDLVWCVMRGPVGACESRRGKAWLETEGGERLGLPRVIRVRSERRGPDIR